LNMNHKKKARQCRGLALDPCLYSSITRSSNSYALMDHVVTRWVNCAPRGNEWNESPTTLTRPIPT
jgi:hypothetical protein